VRSLTLSQYKNIRTAVIGEDFRPLTTARARKFWISWRRFNWKICL